MVRRKASDNMILVVFLQAMRISLRDDNVSEFSSILNSGDFSCIKALFYLLAEIILCAESKVFMIFMMLRIEVSGEDL